jgi:hypothetical protein
VEWRIYPDMSVAPAERKPLLSRIQKDWATERKTVGYTKVLAPAPDDYERLANCERGIMEELLKMFSAGQIDHDRTETKLETNRFEYLYSTWISLAAIVLAMQRPSQSLLKVAAW